MKVCMVVPHFLPHVGGGETLYFDIVKGLQDKGHTVRVVTSNSAGVSGNVPYDGIDTYYYSWKLFCGHPIVRFKDIAPHIKWADIVHTAMFTPASKTRLLARHYNKPCIITIHEVIGSKWFWFEDSKLKAGLFNIYERMICKQPFDAYHVVSDATRRDYKKYCGTDKNVVRIYNSIQMPDKKLIEQEKITVKKYFQLKDGEKCILYFGRPAPNKGIFVLEGAIARLAEQRKIPENIKFCWLLSDDPASQREKLIRRMKKHNLMEYVVIKPSVKRSELFKIIAEADYVVIPSITEGFGFSAVEACSLGRRVICSDGGSLPEVVFGKCLMFKNRNVIDLANKLLQAIYKGDEAFTSIPEKHFDKSVMVENIICLYEKVLKNKRRG